MSSAYTIRCSCEIVVLNVSVVWQIVTMVYMNGKEEVTPPRHTHVDGGLRLVINNIFSVDTERGVFSVAMIQVKCDVSKVLCSAMFW